MIPDKAFYTVSYRMPYLFLHGILKEKQEGRIEEKEQKRKNRERKDMDQTFEKRKKVIYDFICDDFYVPMKIKEIAMVLQITKEQRKELQEVLDSLVEEGKISLSKRGKYSKGQTKRIMGIFQANIRGFGFVMVEGQEEDIFIPAENVNGAFQGDEVECIITGSPNGRRKERSSELFPIR